MPISRYKKFTQKSATKADSNMSFTAGAQSLMPISTKRDNMPSIKPLDNNTSFQGSLTAKRSSNKSSNKSKNRMQYFQGGTVPEKKNLNF
jgi:hypothetical protein